MTDDTTPIDDTTAPSSAVADTTPIFGTQLPPSLPAAAPAPPADRRGPGFGWLAGVVALVLAVALGSGLAGAEIALHRDGGSTTPVASGTVVKGGTSPTEPLAKVAAAVQPSVVSIKVEGSAGTGEGSGVIMPPTARS